jgi:hypothetical protein
MFTGSASGQSVANAAPIGWSAVPEFVAIRGGKAVTASGTSRADIGVSAGRIAAVAHHHSADATPCSSASSPGMEACGTRTRAGEVAYFDRQLCRARPRVRVQATQPLAGALIGWRRGSLDCRQTPSSKTVNGGESFGCVPKLSPGLL